MPSFIAPLIIVCRNSMLLGGRRDTTPRGALYGGPRPSSDSRAPSPMGGIWVYVAHADRLDLVTPSSIPNAAQWRMARRMRLGPRKFASLPIATDTFERCFGHYVGSVFDLAVQRAVETLRLRWQEPLAVAWRVIRCVPSERLPCQWPTENAPRPSFLKTRTDIDAEWDNAAP